MAEETKEQRRALGWINRRRRSRRLRPLKRLPDGARDLCKAIHGYQGHSGIVGYSDLRKGGFVAAPLYVRRACQAGTPFGRKEGSRWVDGRAQ